MPMIWPALIGVGQVAAFKLFQDEERSHLRDKTNSGIP
jgi:hypothetical protein